MRFLILSVICIAIIGLIVAVFLRFKRYFDKKYEEFEDERFRAASGPTEEGTKLRAGSGAASSAKQDETKPEV